MKVAVEKAAVAVEQDRTLVCVYDRTNTAMPWRLRGAIQTEIVAGLRAKDIDAVEVEREPTFGFLTKSSQPGSAADVLRWKKSSMEFDGLVIGQLHRRNDQLELQLAVHRRAATKPVIIPKIVLNKNVLILEANTPKLNIQVREFVRERFGQMIGNGECSTAADEALKAAHAKQIGLYHWGRQLGENEAWLPGDVVQLYSVKFADKTGKVYMGFSGHTAIVEEVSSPNVLRILHQNFGEAGKKISRATLNLNDLQSGTLTGFRPSDGKSSLPFSLLPRRRSPATLAKDGNRIDVLKTIDPHLDVVHGIWHTWEGPLRCHNEAFNRMQIPIDIPTSYTIRATAKRIAGKYGLGFGLVVGGRQTMLVLDSHPGDVTGLHLLDGKQVHEQPDIPHNPSLPLGQVVNLEIRVTPSSVDLLRDGELRFQWTGDATRLSLQPEWEMPNKDWLFLTSHFSDFEITRLTLTFP